MIASSSWAEPGSVGVRYGKGIRGKGYDQFDLYASKDLSWQRSWPDSWLLRSDVEGILGVLTWDGDTAVKPSLMSNLILSSPGKKVEFVAGIGLGVMFGDRYLSDDHDLGGPFFLQGQAGFRVSLADDFFVGYRYYHQSNGKIYANNDSVNLNQIEIVRKF